MRLRDPAASTARRTGLAILLLVITVGCSASSRDDGTSAGPSSSGTTTGPSAGPSFAPVPDPIDGCVPSCNQPGLSQPGAVDPGPYETQWFFGGEMVVTLDEPWGVHEDSTGEFALELDSDPAFLVLFWEDVYPVVDERRVDGVPKTADGLLGWMRDDPRLDVSAPHQGEIGDVSATIVDVSIAATAKNDDPGGCPTDVCALWLGFPQWDGSFGIARPQVQRFYLSDVTYGGERHLFVAVVYPDDPADMESFLPHATDVIRSVQIPATAA